MRKGLKLPSPAMGVATVALLLSTTGGAVAATIISSSSQIKNGAVTGADIKNGTIKSADIATGTRKALRGKDGAPGATGPTGPAGAAGAAGAPGTALAFARVKADQTLDTASSKGVAEAKPAGAGRVCLKLSFAPKNIVASPEWAAIADDGATAQPAIATSLDTICGAGYQAAVLTFNKAGNPSSQAFFAQFN